ncbi:MAG: AI-2E family transporter [Ignavibacteria bacterium]|nr:AI-2E family transporter [Ignavibacteria bacterium]
MADNKDFRLVKIAAALIIVGFVFFILKELQSIILPFFVALIIAFLFEPLYEWLKKKRLPSWAAILIVLITILIISNIASVFVYTSINSFTSGFPKYVQKIESLGVSATNTLAALGVSDAKIKESFDLSKYLSGEKVAEMLSTVLSSIAGIFTNYVLILIYVIFLLTEFGSIQRRILAAFSHEKSRKIAEILNDIFIDLRKYIVGKTLINFVHASLVTIIFLIFGLDFAIVWGLLTFFITYIPNLGAFIATVLPFVTALAQYDNIGTPIVLLVIMGVIAYSVGNLVEPKVLGDKLNLSPLLLIFSLVFWDYMWGVVGMLLSVPIMSMIKIILSKFESTKHISILMSYEVTYPKDDKFADI